MKKFLIPVLFIICFSSCQKSDKIQNSINKSNHESTAVLLNKDAKGGSIYQLTVMAGHLASECKGCVTMHGQTFHIDCMGDGNACAKSSIVSLYQSGYNDYTATTLDSTVLTDEDFFNMPSRSLFVEYDEKNNEVWLNIPAQLVYRDSSTLQFTFNGLFYSSSAVYSND